MTISELQILLDLNKDNIVDVLDSNAAHYNDDYVFVDNEDGQCYLFDKDGKMKNINGLTCIREYMFQDMPLHTIKIPNTVTSIGSFAFYGCKGLPSVTIGNGVTSIGSGAFYNCPGLTNVTIPDSVTRIGDWAFSSCISLMNVTIGNGITNIDEYAFYNCNALKGLIFKGKTMDEVKAMDDYPWGINDTRKINIA